MKVYSEIDDPPGDLEHHNATNDWGIRPLVFKIV